MTFLMFGKSKFLVIPATIFTTFLGGFQLTFASFKDVPSTHVQYQSITTLETQKVIKGFADKTFKPDLRISRGEFLAMVFKDLGFNPPAQENWLAPYIKKASDLNVLTAAMNAKEYDWSKPISRIDAAKLAFPLEGVAVPYSNTITSAELFKDVKPTSSYASLVKVAKQNGIQSVKYPSMFAPMRLLTRGDAAEMVVQLQNVRIKETPGLTITFLDPDQVPVSGLDTADSDLISDPKFPILLDVWKRVSKNFYYQDKVNKGKLVYAAIEGLVNELGDKYTVFQEPVEANELTQHLQGQFEGIGASLDLIGNQLTVMKPLPNTPAEKAGLLAGDVITKINDRDTANITLLEALDEIRGVAGTTVKLTILRGSQTLKLDIVRAKITVTAVSGKILANGIAYIAIDEFTDTSFGDLLKVLDSFGKQTFKSIILDLRGNPGGYVDSAVDVAGKFIEKGKVVVSTVTTSGQKSYYNSNGPSDLAKYPIAVLINDSSASAAEILAAALQDLAGAKLVGEKSFGKGSVQEIENYSDNSLLKITIAHWLTPKGKDIHGIGLTPDINVGLTTDDLVNKRDPQLDKAVEYLLGLP